MNHKLVLTTALLTLLAGCDSSENACEAFGGCLNGAVAGGGGGGAGGGSSSLLSLDRNNALSALREAWFAVSTTPVVLTFVDATGVGTTVGGNFDVDPAGPTVYDCPVAGTFTVTGSITDPDIKTAGDVVNFESSACDSGTGYTVDGNHTINVTSVAGDLNSNEWELGQRLTFTGFRATSAINVVTLDGDYDAIVDRFVADSEATSFSGASLSIREDQATIVLTGYSGFSALELVAPFNQFIDGAGRANSTEAGTFDYMTTGTILQRFDTNPSDGILVVMGAEDSRARIVIEPLSVVTIELDADGNDDFEISVTTTWDDFLNGTATL